MNIHNLIHNTATHFIYFKEFEKMFKAFLILSEVGKWCYNFADALTDIQLCPLWEMTLDYITCIYDLNVNKC